MPSDLHVFGIRHHGPGSARSLLAALDALHPDAVLIEGPPEGEELLRFVGQPGMVPPVALLAYVPDEPQRAAFFPFAEFSPEWQALRYGLSRGVPVRFIDLPQRHWLALKPDSHAALPVQEKPSPSADPAGVAPAAASLSQAPEASEGAQQPVDPLDALAVAAGFPDGERWWEHLVEERPQPAGQGMQPEGDQIFAAVMEMMRILRTDGDEGKVVLSDLPADPLGPVREAAMRQAIRATQREGYGRIAVVCGAWHAPALDLGASGRSLPSAKDDAAILKGLPKVQVKMTWVAWGYEHLSRSSGYGAGAISPGWYEHLWRNSDGEGGSGQIAVRWLARVAELLRGQDLDASAAQVVDAARLAEALAAVRGRPRPGLEELNEASLTVFCFGNPLPMQTIGRELIIGTRLGQVPDDVPMVPLYQDLTSTETRLRLPRQMTVKQYDLDLRQPNDLARSQLLHRLLLLEIPWGKSEGIRGAKGTFHELWTVQWQPGFTVTVIERAIWGNTVAEAAEAYTRHLADAAPDLAALTGLLDRTLLADLDGAAAHLIAQIQAKSALSGDISHLLDALPALARTLRYGNVRQDAAATSERAKTAVDPSLIASILDGMVARICIGLPLACSSLDDDAAGQMLTRMEGVQSSLSTAPMPGAIDLWHSALTRLANQEGLHGLLAGRSCRLLFEQNIYDADEIGRRLSLALSQGNDPARGAAWLEGLLRGSGLLLLHEETLWRILDQWVSRLSSDSFTAVLPLLRRTFSAFPAPERRQMGERVGKGLGELRIAGAEPSSTDTGRADAALPVLAKLLGLKDENGIRLEGL